MKRVTKHALSIVMFGLAVFCQQSLFAQTVSGVVTDQNNVTLPGVNIVVKGTTIGMSTNLNGEYSMDVPSLNDTLIFSYVGFTTLEVPINGRSVVNIVLEENAILGEDIIVVGYGEIRKEEVTGSVSSVNAEDFVTGNVKDAGQLVQGKIAGVSIASPSGDPTSGTQISLRGRTTIDGTSTGPLVLIDGVPGTFETVAPQDIESISVLKDGSAAAIYGVRATNGVILITTKGGQRRGAQPSVTYSSYVSTQQISKKLDLLTAADYRQQIFDGIRNASYDLGSDTDWLDEITRTPISFINNLSLSGGTSQTNYYVNINWQDEEGIFVKSDNNTLRLRTDVNHFMFDDKVKLNVNLMNSRNKYTTTADGGSFNGYTYRQALLYNPTSPIYNEDGSWFEQTGNFNYENPLSRLYESDGENHQEETRVAGSLTYNPIPELTLKGLASYRKYFQSRGYYETKNHISNLRDSRNGYASNGYVDDVEQLIELTADYDKRFDQHRINVLGGFSYSEWDYKGSWMNNFDFPSDYFTYNNIGLGNALREGEIGAGVGSYATRTNLIGYFTRFSYDFNNRYLVMASLRYEGAGQLVGADNPWGLFPAASLGWRISNESFMENIDFVDDLKLRVGYGVTGTQPSAIGLANTRLGYDNWIFVNGQWIQTLNPTQNPNPDLKWEEKEEYNFGLDFVVMDGKISGNVDYYIRDINDLLYRYSVPTPPNIYNSTLVNVGSMRNEGLEVLVEIDAVQTQDFRWTTSFNFSTNRNELTSISNDLYEATNDYFTSGYTGEPIQTFTHIVEVGRNIGDFYGYKVIDIDENGRWIYEDAEGNAVSYDDFANVRGFENKQRLGNGIPNWYAGWVNTFNYKDFDLNISMRGAFDFQVLNMTRMYYENTGVQVYNRLSSAYDPVFGKTVLSTDMPLEFNSYYIEDGDYWKIDNITLGYNIPVGKIKYFSSARVFAASQNTFIISGYKGIDPEASISGLTPGVENRDAYPTTRTFTVGIDINF